MAGAIVLGLSVYALGGRTRLGDRFRLCPSSLAVAMVQAQAHHFPFS